MTAVADSSGNAPPVLEVTDLRVTYRLRRTPHGSTQRHVVAVDGVSFRLSQGETLAVVGESGSGKSTIARAICGLVQCQGTVMLNGVSLTDVNRRERRRLAPQLQMVFQNPYSSLDPSMTIGSSIAEPLEIHTALNRQEREARVAELLTTVGLDPELASSPPRVLSGGQRQRVAIARSIALDPRVLICDEAVSALDVSTQTQVVTLLRRLVVDRGIACLFITHDLALVPDVADRVAVVYGGRIVEEGTTEDLFAHPAHPYTKVLLDAVPVPDPVVQRARQPTIPAEPATSLERPAGCQFHPRCPVVFDRCRVDDPAVVSVGEGHRAACHRTSATETKVFVRTIADPRSSRYSSAAVTIGDPR
jgi:oligopeptide transport system ATP-binding protein